MADVASKSLILRLAGPALAVVVVVAAALALIAFLRSPNSAGELVLAEVSGSVQVIDADGSVQGRPGLLVGAGQQIRTAKGASVVLSAGPNVQIRVEPSTRIRIHAIDDDVVSLELAGGRLRAEVRQGGRPVQIGNGGRTIRTVDGDVDVAVDVDGSLAVQVERGLVSTTGIDGVTELAAGSRLVSLPTGVSAMGDIPEDLLVDVSWPERRRTRSSRVVISGQTQPLCRVRVTGGVAVIELTADESGHFSGELTLRGGEHPIAVTVVDPFGEQVDEEVRIELDTDPPRLSGGLDDAQ